ncbi:MAG: cytochrome c maturation protein CcmE [Cellvibrionaceae bacterium]
MHPARKQRLIFVLFIVAFSSIAVGLLTYSLRGNINLFYPPSKIVNGEAPVDKQIRAGGCVVPGSIVRYDNSLKKSFKVTDGIENLDVVTEEVLPDLFGEGESAVLTGKLNKDGIFVATEVFAKHDENYMPPEVAESMKEGADHTKTCDGLNYKGTVEYSEKPKSSERNNDDEIKEASGAY